ncbi:hypothetical protein [Paenibacillus hunanensis]
MIYQYFHNYILHAYCLTVPFHHIF